VAIKSLSGLREHFRDVSFVPLNRESERIPRSLTSTSSVESLRGLARVSENGKLLYGRRFPVPTCRDCRDLQSPTWPWLGR
jgi:hypothetical protein